MRVPHVGTRTKLLPVSRERLYENALDWEHLPFLHSSSFSSIEVQEHGDWGWRARVGITGTDPEVKLTLELRLDRDCHRWITTTLEGPGAGSEIWTHAFPVAERETWIVIDFFVPGVTEDGIEGARQGFFDLYDRLYVEDVAMMVDRQTALDEKRPSAPSPQGPVSLGDAAALRASLPRNVEAFGRTWRIVEVEGELLAHPERCPHKLGSLLEAPVEGRELVCPWHGYRFDLETGACTSGARHRLGRMPCVTIRSGAATLEMHDQSGS